MIDPVSIAAASVAILASYFHEGAKEFVKKLGGAAADGVVALLGRLKARLTKPAAEEALADLEDAPDNTDRQGALRVQLEKALTEDSDFRLELAGLLDDLDGQVEGGLNQIVNIIGDGNINIQISGSGNIIDIPGKGR